MESSSPPPWVEFILAEMNRRFDAQDRKLDQLVTQTEFRDEKTRVNDALREMSKDISKNTADIQAEATARANSEIVRANRERDEVQRTQATERQTRWQWFAIPFSAVVGYLVTYAMNGGMSQ